MTPSGRFEVNREICLSISGHHEETWQPAWGIRTALVALRSFMDTDAKGQLGGLECEDGARRDMAARSRRWRCAVCGKSNEHILEGQELDQAAGKSNEAAVPDGLRLAYREDLSAKSSKAVEPSTTASSATQERPSVQATGQRPAVVARRRGRQSQDTWLDKAIYAIAALLAILVVRKLVSFIR
jgi:ubiquitin-conjugating enzyme E2 J1